KIKMKFLFVFCLSWALLINSFSQNQLKTDNYLDTAALFKESGEYEKAEDVLKILKSADDNQKALQYRARLNFLSAKSNKALLIFNNLKDKNWQTFLYLGLIYEDLGQPNLAADNYLLSLKLKQNSIALLRLAKIYRGLGQYKKAVDFLSKLRSFDSSLRLVYYYLGECYLKLNQYEQAYNFLSKAQGFYPQAENINERFLEAKKALGQEFFIAKKKEKEEIRAKIKVPFYQPLEGSPLVRIGIAENLAGFSFSCAEEFTISSGKKIFKAQADKFYNIIFEEDKLVIKDYKQGFVLENFSGPLQIASLTVKEIKGAFYILDVISGKGNFWHKKTDRAYRGDLEVLTAKGKLTLVNILSQEEYLYGVLPAEIPRLAPGQSLRAQAIAARTYTFKNLGRHKNQGFDLCADVHCQVYQGIFSEFFTTNKAVDDTRSLIMTREDKLIEVFYHSNCGGCLGSDVFGLDKDYGCRMDFEQGVTPNSPYQEEMWFLEQPRFFCSDPNQSKNRWQRVYDSEDFKLAFGFDLESLKAIEPLEKGNCFRYKKMSIVSKDKTETLGTSFKIRKYFDNLKSSAFKFEVKSSLEGKPEMLFFWGAGFGHGAGLCQEGAMEMGKQGYSYQEILQHYYPSIELKKIH
ncbi:MAG: SpoIID/LytB domain-containing protein, partial [Candidatus Omnitrophota bacterium]